MTAAWTDPVIDVYDLPSFNARGYAYRRDDVCDLLQRLGVDPHGVVAVRYQVIDAPLLTLTLIARDDTDRIVCDEFGPVYREADVLLRCSLPDWWQPSPG